METASRTKTTFDCIDTALHSTVDTILYAVPRSSSHIFSVGSSFDNSDAE